MNMVLNISGNE